MSRTGLRRGLAGLGVVLLGILVTGCGGAPDGFRTLEQGHLRVSVPESWEPGDTEPGSTYDIALQDDPKQLDADHVFVASSDFPDNNARLALRQAALFTAFGSPDASGGMTELHSGDDGSMWRWDFTIGDGSHQVVVWARDDGSRGNVVVAGLVGKGGLDESLVNTIEDSFEIVPGQEPTP